MRRSLLKKIAKEIAAEYQKYSYDYWFSVELPITFEREYKGRIIQVEIHVLEFQKDYVKIGVSVDGGGLSAFFPACYGFIIEK